jgi:hypothetical protein
VLDVVSLTPVDSRGKKLRAPDGQTFGVLKSVQLRPGRSSLSALLVTSSGFLLLASDLEKDNHTVALLSSPAPAGKKPAQRGKMDNFVVSASFDKRGSRIVAGTNAAVIRVFALPIDDEGGGAYALERDVKVAGSSAAITSVTFSNAGDLVLLNSADNTLR